MKLKSLILVSGLVLALSVPALACGKDKQAKSEMSSANTATAAFTVSGMHCGNCATHVKEALTKVEGVQNAIVSYADSRAVVEYNPEKVDVDHLLAAAQGTGFAVSREVKEVKESKLSSNQGCDPSKASACPHAAGKLSGQGKSCCEKKAKKVSFKPDLD